MDFCIKNSGLVDIYEKVTEGKRITEEEGLRLFKSNDLNALSAIADLANRRKNGNRAAYLLNRYINYSNYCILSCQFCAFGKKKRDNNGFELTIEEILERARQAIALGATELHIVGGLHPSLPYNYYTGFLKALKKNFPQIHIKAFTAIEILHLSWLAKKTVKDTLLELKETGLDCLTGGGAEIFNPQVRNKIARGKETAEEYLEVHRTWHKLGGRSTCTMLYGHVESLEDRIDHLRRLRELQDETGGFCGFIPLPYQPENNEIPVEHPPTGFDTLRTIAVSRVFLDNIKHITAYWVGMGLKLAQVALNFGADDLHGTIQEEYIFHMAGAKTPQLLTEQILVRTIQETGKIAVQRNTFYEPIKIWDKSIANPAKLSNLETTAILNANLATG
ncbi:MAG: aminofutalosine synthase MqnE [Verrucomicrobiae bacterium]|nr:aminofutalosine synthase MqnE [Verrucomicrobiae bacterium]